MQYVCHVYEGFRIIFPFSGEGLGNRTPLGTPLMKNVIGLTVIIENII